jgi:hypothetical protein
MAVRSLILGLETTLLKRVVSVYLLPFFAKGEYLQYNFEYLEHCSDQFNNFLHDPPPFAPRRALTESGNIRHHATSAGESPTSLVRVTFRNNYNIYLFLCKPIYVIVCILLRNDGGKDYGY